MSLGGGNPELQEVAQQLEEIEERREGLEAEIERLNAKKQEIDEAIEAIEAIETGSTVQVPLGGGAYARTEIANLDEIVVELGGGYAAERDEEGAVKTLETKKDTFDERIGDVEAEIETLESESAELEERAQQLQSQQLQQMQQQSEE